MAHLALPKRVRIGYLDYKVEANRATDEILIAKGLAGRSDGNRAKIQALTTYPLRNKQDTLLHEILHQVLFVAGQTNDDEVEEPIIRAMSMGLLQVLRDNPKVVAYLTQE